MKYFTKEELEDITNSILENPSYEMLNELNKKYNGEVNAQANYEEENKVEVSEDNAESAVETSTDTNATEVIPSQDNVSSPEEVPNESTQEVPSFELQMNNTPEVEMPSENVSAPEFPSFEFQTENPVVTETPSENVSVPEFPQFNLVQPEPVMNNDMPNTTDLSSPSFEVPNQNNNIGIQIIHDPNSQMTNMPNNMNTMMNNGPVLNSGMQPFYGSMEPQTNKTPDIVFSNNSNMNNMAQNQMNSVPQDGMFSRESWAPHIENNNINNMSMPGTNQMPNAGPQYQPGPSMFSQLQNPNQQ